VATVDLWVLSILLVLLVPPCGFISLLCLMLARRSRSAGSTSSSDVTATYLERVACSTVVTALCSLLAVNFYTDELYRNHIIRYLVSSICFYDGTNSTVLPTTVRSFQWDHLSSLDDPSVKQHFVSKSNMSLLQFPVDMELSVVRRNAKVLLLPHLHANSSSSSTFAKP